MATSSSSGQAQSSCMNLQQFEISGKLTCSKKFNVTPNSVYIQYLYTLCNKDSIDI